MRWACLLLLGLALVALAAAARAAPGLENPALLEDHAPIRIDSDAFFDAAHGVRGGNGTAEDPFLIAHWRINSTEQHIRIANTTKAWVVRNVELNGQCDTGGQGNACLFEAGVYVENVVGGVVLHARVNGMDRSGLYAERSRGVEFVENHVLGGAGVTSGQGIYVHFSRDVQVRGNLLEGQGAARPTANAALRVHASNDTLVAGNVIRDATDEGLNLIGARRTLVEDNTFTGNRVAVLAQGFEAILRYNTIRENRLAGVLVSNGVVQMERNDISVNPRGVDFGVGVLLSTMRVNNLEGNTEFGLRIAGNTTVDARENYWGSSSGPNVNHTGPGTGQLVVLDLAKKDQFLFQPFLAERAPNVGAFASRAGRTIVSSSAGSSGGNTGAPLDPAPVAVFEGPGDAYTGQTVEFNAARSFDPEGGALRYAWDLGDGTTGAGLRARATYAQPGEYVVRLTVTDPTGLSGVASIALAVTRQPFEVALQVNATASRGEELLLRAIVGGASGDVRYRFTTNGPGTFEGEPGPSSTASVRLTEAREYVLGVEARADNETRTAFQRVLVGNQPPVARLEVEPENGSTGDDFRFTAARSTDPDGDALTFTWDFGDGDTASGANVTRRFPTPGLHVVQLTVNDGSAIATEQKALEVKPGSAAAPPKPAPGPELLAFLAALALAVQARRPRR